MSNDIGNKRPIDDIQDDETAELRKVPSQEADIGHGVTDTDHSDTGVATETTTTQNTTSTTGVQGSNICKSQERQRSQRMFGMLMGTLNKFDKAQKQNEQQARKRQAIDAKQQERLLEEKKAIQASLLSQQDRAKKNQQRLVDLDENKLKQDVAHQKKLAHYLITTAATTRLTYLPKKLLPHQQEQIDRQIRDANASVTTTTESGQDNDKNQQDNDKDQQDKEE